MALTHLAAAEEALSLSSAERVDLAELHPNYMFRVERGGEQVSLNALRRIAKVLEVLVRLLVWNI